MKTFILITLSLLSFSTLANNDYADLERLQKIIKIDSCDIKVRNKEIRTRNCTITEKSNSVKKEMERQERYAKRKANREIERKINKQIKKVFDKL